jgi:hypothetical protein
VAVVIGTSVSAPADSLRLHAVHERDPDPYAVLRISRAATRAEVARAYRALAKRLHPDVSAGDSDAMRRVNWAWHVLSDPTRRAGWDAAHFTAGAGHWSADRRVRPTVRAAPPDTSWTGWAEYREGYVGSEPMPISAGLSLGCVSLVIVVLLLMLFVLLAGLASTGGRDPGSVRTPPGVTAAP